MPLSEAQIKSLEAPLDRVTVQARDFARFMSNVVVGDSHHCWPWRGSLGRGGYGRFPCGGKTKRAHKWIFEVVTGKVPDGLVVRHKCDNPACVNPAHLELGTNKDNTQDMLIRGRGANRKGILHPLSRLTEDDVRAIRKQVGLGESHAVVSQRFGIKRGQVGKIVNRINWGHVI